MNESIQVRVEELKVFIDSVTRYFAKVTLETPEVSVPYSKGSDTALLDYTGVIGISGRLKGAVYFTANIDLLIALLAASGEDRLTAEMAADAVGEVANVIAGNARKVFGAEFRISVPVVIKGRPQSVELGGAAQSYVIPILWRRYRSYLVVGFE